MTSSRPASPACLLTIDLAEFAAPADLDPRLAPRAKASAPTTTAWSSAPTPAPAARRWAAAGATTACSARLGAEVPAVGFSLSLERLLDAGVPRAPEGVAA